MADFRVYFDGHFLIGLPIRRYYGYSKDSLIRLVKRDADENRADIIDIEYLGSGKSVGRWVKRGSRWYKEW